VLEKHADFLRDFRGDTIHPSTLEVIAELGLLDDFLARPHQKVSSIRAAIGDQSFEIADFSHLPTRCRFIALMPQWDFLDFLADSARRYPGFRLMMQAEATGLLRDQDRVTGVVSRTPDGDIAVRADLVIAADGRHSTLREKAGLKPVVLGAPIDVLWMRLSRRDSDPDVPVGRFEAGSLFVMIYRGDYWQCAMVIPKGGFESIRARGIEAFRDEVARLANFGADQVGEIRSFDDVKLLTVAVDRLERWVAPGLLCIGDAAHAMSPIGGVGINLAIQDAVAAANILAGPLAAGPPPVPVLERVERRRLLPTRLTQWAQVQVQNRILKPTLAATSRPRPPLVVKLLDRCPVLRRIPARLIGVGVRPEHVETPGYRGGAAATGDG